MGWTYLHRESGISNKDFFSKEFNFENEIVKSTVLETATVGSVVYLAIENVLKSNNERYVFGVVCLTKKNKNDYYNFGYKDMDETCGPCECDCPEKILKLLTPIIGSISDKSYEYSKDWRDRCWQNINKKKTIKSQKLSVGDIVEFEHALSFNGIGKFNKLEVCKIKPLRFLVNGNLVRVTRRTMNNNAFNVVTKV